MEQKELSPREQALRVIEEGGSVFVGNTQYTKDNVRDLPDDVEFAGSDPVAQEEAIVEMEAELARVKARLEMARQRVGLSTSTVSKSEPTPAKETTSTTKETAKK